MALEIEGSNPSAHPRLVKPTSFFVGTDINALGFTLKENGKMVITLM